MKDRFKKPVLAMLVLICLVSLLGIPITAQAKMTLRWAHYAAETHPLHLSAVKFKEIIEKETNGDITIEIYPNNTLGSSVQILENFKAGGVDMSSNTTGQLQQWVPEACAVQFLYIFEDPEHAYKVLDNEGGQMIADLAEPKGFKILSWWDWGFRQFTNSKRPINTPEDVKGLKFRISPEISMEAAFHALGAITEKIAFAELYMALAQGVVDGQDNGIPATYHMKFYEHNKYIAMVNYMYQPAIHMISTATWAKLTPDQQKLFMTASAECRDYMRQLMLEDERSLIPKMEAAGVQFTYPDPAVFQAVMEPAMIQIADFTGREFSKKFLAATKAYAKKDSTKAYLQKMIDAF